MQKQHLAFLIGVILFISSCNEGTRNKKRNELKKVETNFKETITKTVEIEKKETPQFIENDSLTYLLLSELKLFTKNFKNFNIKSELSENKHDKNQIDTIKTLTFDKSKIIGYSTGEFYAILNADIKNTELPIWNYVKIGMKKHQLEKILATQLKSDTIEFRNLEQTSLFKFYFNKGNLDRVKFERYVD